MARLGRAPAQESAQAVQEIGRVLDQVLPRDDPGALRAALDSPDTRSATTAPDEATTRQWQQLASELLRQAERRDLAPARTPPPLATEITFWTGRWLLAEPALSKDELRDRGQAPGDPTLIRLDRDEGGAQWPAFQFGPDGAPLRVVRAVNELLDAEEDPWGAADWWLGHNQWLDAAPARLIGEVADDLLIDAARALDPGA